MWIRSQNKRQLSNVSSIWYTEGDNPNGRYIYGGVGGECERLGEYATMERALEVIDEIQQLLVLQKDFDILPYEMPKE